MADIIAIEDVYMPALVEQFALEFRGDGGFAGTGQAGEPQDATALAVAHFALACGDLAVAPIDVVALGVRIMGAPRIIVVGDDAAARHVEAVHLASRR